MRLLAASEVANGFGNRHLFALVRRSKLLPFGGTVDRDVIRTFAARVADRLVSAGGTGEMCYDAPAAALWADRYEHLSRDRFGLAGSLCNRAEPHVTRLALLYALADGRHNPRRTLTAAFAALEYNEASAIFGDAAGRCVADPDPQVLRDTALAGLARTEIAAAPGGTSQPPRSLERWTCCVARGDQMGNTFGTGNPRKCGCQYMTEKSGQRSGSWLPHDTTSLKLCLLSSWSVEGSRHRPGPHVGVRRFYDSELFQTVRCPMWADDMVLEQPHAVEWCARTITSSVAERQAKQTSGTGIVNPVPGRQEAATRDAKKPPGATTTNQRTGRVEWFVKFVLRSLVAGGTQATSTDGQPQLPKGRIVNLFEEMDPRRQVHSKVVREHRQEARTFQEQEDRRSLAATARRAAGNLHLKTRNDGETRNRSPRS